MRDRREKAREPEEELRGQGDRETAAGGELAASRLVAAASASGAAYCGEILAFVSRENVLCVLGLEVSGPEKLLEKKNKKEKRRGLREKK